MDYAFDRPRDYDYHADGVPVCLAKLPEDEQIHNYIYAAAAGLLFITVLVFVLFSKLQNQLAIVRDNQEMKLQMDLQKQSVEKWRTAYNHTAPCDMT